MIPLLQLDVCDRLAPAAHVSQAPPAVAQLTNPRSRPQLTPCSRPGPRRYSIAVIVWTALPRPRKGAPSHSSLDAPDLTWTTSEAGSTGVVNGVGDSGAGGHSPARMWTMLARPTALPGARGLRKKASFLRRGGRAEAAEPRQWVVDLEADHDQVEKIDFSSAADDDVRLGQASAPARLGDDGADQAESIELQQWRESMVLGKARTVSGLPTLLSHTLSRLTDSLALCSALTRSRSRPRRRRPRRT